MDRLRPKCAHIYIYIHTVYYCGWVQRPCTSEATIILMSLTLRLFNISSDPESASHVGFMRRSFSLLQVCF